jgi:SulP family sulfate permease
VLVLLSAILAEMRVSKTATKAIFKALKTSVVIIGALKIAFVAVLETLISARIADNKTNTRFDQSQEIFGMAICNMVCGLLGGTPCTGVLIRTNVNIQTNATHKIS